MTPSAPHPVLGRHRAEPGRAQHLGGRVDQASARRGWRRDELGRLVGHPSPGDGHVVGVEVVADVAAPGAGRGDERRARAHERVEHEVVGVGVELDELLGQLDGERRRVADPAGALGRDAPTRRGWRR